MERSQDIRPHTKSVASQIFSGFGYAFLLVSVFFLVTSVAMGGGEGPLRFKDKIFLPAWSAFVVVTFCLAAFRPPLKSKTAWGVLWACYIAVAIAVPGLLMS
jgi:hypothetical protein